MLQNPTISSTCHDNDDESKSNIVYADFKPIQTSPTISINVNKRQICTEEDAGYQYKIGSPKLQKLCDIANQARFVSNSVKINDSSNGEIPSHFDTGVKSSASTVMVGPNQKPPRRKPFSIGCGEVCALSRTDETINNNVDKLNMPVIESKNIRELSTTCFTTSNTGDIDPVVPILADDSDYQEQYDFIEKLMERIHQEQRQQTHNICNNDSRMVFDISSTSSFPSESSFSPNITINTDSQSMDNRSSMQSVTGYQDRNYQEARYKTELCLHFRERNSCPHGNRCLFAHGLEELRPYRGRHPKHKTQNCRAFHEDGYCNYGYRCSYIHSESPRTIAYIKKLNRKAQAIKRTRIFKMNKQMKKNDRQQVINNNNNNDHSNDQNYDFQNQNINVIYQPSTSNNNSNNYNNFDNIEQELQETITLRFKSYLQERKHQHQRVNYQ